MDLSIMCMSVLQAILPIHYLLTCGCRETVSYKLLKNVVPEQTFFFS